MTLNRYFRYCLGIFILFTCLTIVFAIDEPPIAHSSNLQPSTSASVARETIRDLGPAPFEEFWDRLEEERKPSTNPILGVINSLSGRTPPTNDELIEIVKEKLTNAGYSSIPRDVIDQVRQRLQQEESGSTEGTTGETGGTGGGTGDTGSTENTPPTNTPTKTPEALCEDSEGELDSGSFSNALNGSGIIEDTSFIDQWCKFYKSEDKQNVWGKLSDDQKKQFMENLGRQYGMEIKGLETGEWNKNKITVNGNTIDMDLENFYGKDDFSFGFRGKDDYLYNQKPIRSITATENGVTMQFGDEGKSVLELQGGASFDPQTRMVTVGEKSYEWNGQGSVSVDGPNGKMKLNFVPGKSDSDTTNFPIMKLPNGEEISPYQVSAKTSLPEGVTKPSSGFTVFGEGKYTVDSDGNVREIKSAEVEIDKATGNVKAIKDAYINKKELGGDLFVDGEFGLSKDSGKKNYFEFTGDSLTVVNDGGKLYYKLNKDLKKLDVKGSGSTFIRNGDAVMEFTDGKVMYKIMPKEFQEASGGFKYTIDEIVNYKDEKNPFKVVKGEDGKLSLVDSTDKPVEPDGSIQQPPQDDTPPTDNENNQTGGGNGGGGNQPVGNIRGLTVNPDGTASISTKTRIVPQGKIAQALVAPFDAVSTSVSISGIGDLPEGLTKEQFIAQFGTNDKLSVDFSLDILSGRVSGQSISDSLKKNMNAPDSIISLVQSETSRFEDPSSSFGIPNDDGQLKGQRLTLQLQGSQVTGSFGGNAVTIPPNVQKDIPGFIAQQMQTVPPQSGFIEGPVIAYVQLSDGSPVTRAGADKLYEYYKALGK